MWDTGKVGDRFSSMGRFFFSKSMYNIKNNKDHKSIVDFFFNVVVCTLLNALNLNWDPQNSTIIIQNCYVANRYHKCKYKMSSDNTKQRKKAAVDCNHTTPSDTNTTDSVVGEKR